MDKIVISILTPVRQKLFFWKTLTYYFYFFFIIFDMHIAIHSEVSKTYNLREKFQNPSDTYFYVPEHSLLFSIKKKFRCGQGGLTPTPFSFTEMTATIRFLSFKWADWLSHSLICPHNALVSHLNLVPGFRACFLRLPLGPPPSSGPTTTFFLCVYFHSKNWSDYLHS